MAIGPVCRGCQSIVQKHANCHNAIENMVPCDLTRCLLAYHGMKTLGVHYGSIVAVVWDAQTELEPHTDSCSHCLIVKAQAAISDGQRKKPITTVRRLCSQEPRSVRLLNKTEDLMSARSARRPRLSQKDCFSRQKIW